MNRRFPWFRLYANDTLNDKKIKRIHKVTGISLAEIRGVWLTLLCLASESPDRGMLLFDGSIPYDYDDLAEECGMDSMKFHSLFMHFTKMGMVAYVEEDGIYYLPAWDVRQPKSDATGAERVAKHRQRKNKKRVTLQKRYSNALEEDKEEDKEKEEEYNAFPFSDIQPEEPNSRYRQLLGTFFTVSRLPIDDNLRPRDNDAVKQWIRDGCTAEDIQDAVQYCTTNGYTITGPASIHKSVMIARSNRLRQESVSSYGSQEVWTEEHS